jgi:hypothetical protein
LRDRRPPRRRVPRARVRPHHDALLQQPERLATVLLDWMKRLLVA